VAIPKTNVARSQPGTVIPGGEHALEPVREARPDAALSTSRRRRLPGERGIRYEIGGLDDVCRIDADRLLRIVDHVEPILGEQDVKVTAGGGRAGDTRTVCRRRRAATMCRTHNPRRRIGLPKPAKNVPYRKAVVLVEDPPPPVVPLAD